MFAGCYPHCIMLREHAIYITKSLLSHVRTQEESDTEKLINLPTNLYIMPS
jgi:hypothetical protein